MTVAHNPACADGNGERRKLENAMTDMKQHFPSYEHLQAFEAL